MSIETFNLISAIGMIVVICFAIVWFSVIAICIIIRTIEYKKYIKNCRRDFIKSKEKEND